MELFVFHHDPPVYAGCCNWETSATYWMADEREEAEDETAEHTPDSDRPHGLCPHCMMEVLASGNYEIIGVDA